MPSYFKSPAGKREIMALYHGVLANWPVAHEEMSVNTRHGDTFIIASGAPSAPALVLLHGANSNAVSWVADAAAYSACFRVYAVDLPGEPGKSAQIRPAWYGPAYAEWLEDLLNGLGVQKASLLGISQGGWTALRFATVHPERVAKLVLLTPAGVMPTKASFILKALFYRMLGPWGAERINRMVFGSDPIHPDAVRFMNVIMTHFKARIEKEYIFTDAELQCLEMPVLVMGGSEDAIQAMARVNERLRRLSPQVEAVLLPGVGHALVNLSGRVLPFLLN